MGLSGAAGGKLIHEKNLKSKMTKSRETVPLRGKKTACESSWCGCGVQGSDQGAGPEGAGTGAADRGGDWEAEERLRGEGAGGQGGPGAGRILKTP